jgi:hypothetical protein
MAEIRAKVSYADSLKERIAHAPAAPTKIEGEQRKAAALKEDAVEPELVAAVTNMGKFDKIHPTRAVAGEVLPKGFSRSCTGFLLCNEVLKVKVNQDVVKLDTEHLQKHAVVAYFVGGKQSPVAINQWLTVLQRQVGDWIGIGRELGHGFFQLLSKQPATTQKILMLTPHKSRWGTCILQTWTPGFVASKPTGLKVPTWVTLKDVPGEFMRVAAEMASGLGELLGSDRRNAVSRDQRFCVGITSGAGYRTYLSVMNEFTGKEAMVLIDYCNLPIRCRYCLSPDHLVKDCVLVTGGSSEEEAPVTGSASATSPGNDEASTKLSDPPEVPEGVNPTILIEEDTPAQAGGRQSGEVISDLNKGEPAKNQSGINSHEAGIQTRRDGAANTRGNIERIDNGNGGSREGNSTESEPRSYPGDRSSEEYRSTPEFEWNGWEKVYRGKKKIMGPAQGDKQPISRGLGGSQQGIGRDEDSRPQAPHLPRPRPIHGQSPPSPSGIRSGIGAHSLRLGGDRRNQEREDNMDWANNEQQQLNKEVQSEPSNPERGEETTGQGNGPRLSQVIDTPTSGQLQPRTGIPHLAVPPNLVELADVGRRMIHTERMGESQPVDSGRPSIDVNRLVEHSMVFGSNGEASRAPLHNLQISTNQATLGPSTTSTPRTPLTSASRERVPEHLHAEFLEWMKSRNVNIVGPNRGFLTPQPRRLSDFQVQRRQDISDSARRLRTSILHSRRGTSQGSPSNSIGGQQHRTRSARSAREGVTRGPLTFPEPSNPEL